MKDLKEIAANFNPTQQAMSKKEVIIDDFAKNIIDKVFDQLSVIFPAWKHALPTEKDLSLAKMEWTKAFNENNINSLEQIKLGFKKARASESDFLPSCGRFISWCNPTPEDLGYPSEQKALKECLTHRRNMKMFNPPTVSTRPFIIELCKKVDWWLIDNASNQYEHKKADKHFKDQYLELINSEYVEPEVTSHDRLETSDVVEKRKSPEQKEAAQLRVKESIGDIKKKLAIAKHESNKDKK